MSKYNNGWTPEITKKIKILKEKTWSYTWIHRENSIYLADIYEWVSIIAYSLSFFNAVILIFPTNLIYVRIFNILLSFGSGLLIFYIKNKKLTETAEKHKIASSKFSNIYNNIERQLSLESQNRELAHHYHRWITQVYDALYGSAPDIDPPIIDEYIKKFAKKRKVNPIEAAEFDRSSSSKNKSSTNSSSSNNFHHILDTDSSETEDSSQNSNDVQNDDAEDRKIEKTNSKSENKIEKNQSKSSNQNKIEKNQSKSSNQNKIEKNQSKSSNENKIEKNQSKSSNQNIISEPIPSKPKNSITDPIGIVQSGNQITQVNQLDDHPRMRYSAKKQLKLSKKNLRKINPDDSEISYDQEPIRPRRKHNKRLEHLTQQAKIHMERQPESGSSQKKLFEYELSRVDLGNMSMGTKCFIPEYEFKHKEIKLTKKKNKK